ncbi:MAG: TylF/MycF family methyltransferase [Magnetococcus sp. YQC-5]
MGTIQNNLQDTNAAHLIHLRDAYLDLLEQSLTGMLYEDPPMYPLSDGHYNPSWRATGADWPKNALTMIGQERMQNLRFLASEVLRKQIPGDFIETGVWRGGACIYLRGILKAYDCHDRTVWVADSFAGLPQPDAVKYPVDHGNNLYQVSQLAVSIDEVQKNFVRYGLLDQQVRFLHGWFHETLPTAPIQALAILRLDGDLYESTFEALNALYHKVSPGGYVVVDDSNLFGCVQAINDFRAQHAIQAPIIPIGAIGVYWEVPMTPHNEQTSSVSPDVIAMMNTLFQHARNGTLSEEIFVSTRKLFLDAGNQGLADELANLWHASKK